MNQKLNQNWRMSIGHTKKCVFCPLGSHNLTGQINEPMETTIIEQKCYAGIDKGVMHFTH